MDTTERVELKERGRSVNMSKLLAPLALVIVYAFFSIFGRNFFSYTTLVNILDSSYYIGFIAIG
ncbi:MAG: ABC transporter permease, partial [Spirochaetales bacterium]|nr:ABC transporter permease [Spirochaetales bacterium]